jgi:dihydrodipicolinate synthase/N-acetylneuraminate lyase
MMLSKPKQRFLAEVKGPVFPIPTPFKKNGDVDFEGLRKYVGFLLDQGATTIMVTVGTSRFDVLAVDEMQEVNRVVAQSVGSRGTVIVTTPVLGPTFQAKEFARRAEADGAAGILLVFPGRYYSDKQVIQYFEDVAASCSIGILVHLAPIPAGRAGLGPSVQYSPDLLRRIFEIDNVVGIKEESQDPGLSYQYSRSFSEFGVIIGGAGGMRDYLTKHQWGQQAYLVGVGNLVPSLEIEFYQAVVHADYDAARRIVFDFEEPFFNLAVKAGWHLALKEAMAYLGLVSRYEREPLPQLSGNDKDNIGQLLGSEGWQKFTSGCQKPHLGEVE